MRSPVHVIFHVKIGRKSRKITRTKENYANPPKFY